MPDFQSWMEVFGANSVVLQDDYKPKEATDPPVKYQLDEEMIPPNMIDIDDQRVRNIKQTLNQYLPDDNSIITSEEYHLGGVLRIKPVVYKNKLQFGFRNVTNQFLPQPSQYGLVSYKPQGNFQFWLNFSDFETKLTVEIVEAARNPQRMIEVKPPEPTPEEIAAKEEAAKAAAAAAAKNKKGPV
jgi:hypothetical protein